MPDPAVPFCVVKLLFWFRMRENLPKPYAVFQESNEWVEMPEGILRGCRYPYRNEPINSPPATAMQAGLELSCLSKNISYHLYLHISPKFHVNFHDNSTSTRPFSVKGNVFYPESNNVHIFCGWSWLKSRILNTHWDLIAIVPSLLFANFKAHLQIILALKSNSNPKSCLPTFVTHQSPCEKHALTKSM